MVQYNQRKDPMRVMWRRLLALVLVIFVAVAARGVWSVYQKAQDSGNLKIEAQAKLDDLKKRELELRTDISSLRSDRGIEAELRERYNLAAAGESVIIIVDPPQTPPEPKSSPFQRFKSMFSW